MTISVMDKIKYIKDDIIKRNKSFVKSVQILMRNIRTEIWNAGAAASVIILYKISRFGPELPGEDPSRGGQNGANGPDGENHQQDLHPARLGGQGLHDGLQGQTYSYLIKGTLFICLVWNTHRLSCLCLCWLKQLIDKFESVHWIMYIEEFSTKTQ